jgi:hypothetical protein
MNRLKAEVERSIDQMKEQNKPSPRVIHAMCLDLADRLEHGLRPGDADYNTYLRDVGKLMQKIDIDQAEWLRDQILEFAETNGWFKPQGLADFIPRTGYMSAEEEVKAAGLPFSGHAGSRILDVYGEQRINDHMALYAEAGNGLHHMGTLSVAATRYIHQMLMNQNARFTQPVQDDKK